MTTTYTTQTGQALTYTGASLRTSYTNQRHGAVKHLGADTACLHGATLADGCVLCRASGCVLLPLPTPVRPTNEQVQAELRRRGHGDCLYTSQASAVRDDMER